MSETAPNFETEKPQGHSHENPKPKFETPKTAESKPIDIEAARATALEQPEVPLELPVDDSPEGNQPLYIDRAMKRVSLQSELKRIRERLPRGQRILSQTVHQPVIGRISDASAKTITRPIGLLGGGLLAFVGSLVYLLFSKYIGVKYNYLIFVFLFVFGYLVATIAEFLLKASRSPK